MSVEASRSLRFFRRLTGRPKTVLAIAAALVAVAALGLPALRKDTSFESWFPADHPARQSRAEVRRIFGIGNPLVVAVVKDGPHGVFDPPTLALVDRLSRAIARIPGVDPEKIAGLATSRRIVADEDGFESRRFFDEVPATQVEADRVRRDALASELFRGTLVAHDGSATLLVAELLDDEREQEAYAALRSMVALEDAGGATLHIAGAAAVQGFLNEYLDIDGRRLNPIALGITLLLFLVAFRRALALLVPVVVIGGTLAATLGIMAAVGVPWYSLTGALTVVLIAGSVCDSIHILGRYYEEVARDPEADAETVVSRAMASVWSPVTSTSATNMTGFWATASSTFMQPVRAFGYFAAVGFVIAQLLSVLVVPALLVLFRPRQSPAYHSDTEGGVAPDWFGRLTRSVGHVAVGYPRLVLAVAAAISVGAAVAVTRVEIDDEAIRYFQPDAPIVVADRLINERFDGTNTLDIVIAADAADALYRPEHLRRVEALETFLRGHALVGGTTSIVTYVKEMNRALAENAADAYVVPDDPDLVAQLFFLYLAGGSPTALRSVVTADFRSTVLRVRVKSGRWSRIIPFVEEVERHLREHFDAPGISARLSGYVNVAYHRAVEIRDSQPMGVDSSLAIVAALSAVFVGSPVAGILAVVPIAFSVLVVYAVMGLAGIWISTGTTIFASIAIGLGVDFCIHILESLKTNVREHGMDLDSAFHSLFSATGRGIFFNFLVITLGFGVLLTSEAPPLATFGLLVAAALAAAFASSMLVLPALVKVLQPAFLMPDRPPVPLASPTRRAIHGLWLAAMLAAGTTYADETYPSADDVVGRVRAVATGESETLTLAMELTDAGGQVRTQQARVFRKDDAEHRRTAIFFDKPTHLRGTAFLTIDNADPLKADDRWLYLPALRKVRRIAAADRGGYFLGTDFTYDDIRNGSGLVVEDYRWKTLGREDVDGHPCLVLEGIPASPDVAAELGYGRTRSWIDGEIWKRRRFEAWDLAGNALKRVDFRDLKQVDGIWTPGAYEARNHKTGHVTRITVEDVQFAVAIDDEIFTEAALRRGPP